MLVSKDCFPDEEYAKVAFIGGMLSHGLDAPLLSELRGKRGLVYFADFDLASYLHGGHLFLYGDTGSGAKALLLKKAFYKFLSDAPALSTRKRFVSTKKWFVSKKKAMVLNGMYNKDLLYAGKMDPFLGVEDFTYQEILEAVKKWLNPESYVAYVEGITKW
jgi:predicted Zn-dependent peptidase